MVNVKCARHGTHAIKPTDAAKLLEYYIDVSVDLAFSPPLPNIAGISDPEAVKRVACPMTDLAMLKRRQDAKVAEKVQEKTA